MATNKAPQVKNPKADPKSIYKDYTPVQLKTQFRKATKVAERQVAISVAGKACERLMDTPDFRTVIDHLRDTASQMALDAPQRQNVDQRQQDQVIIQSIAVVLDMIETLPEIGETMAKNALDTKKAADTIRSLI